MVRRFTPAVILAAASTLIFTHAAASDYRQTSWNVSISVGNHGGNRHYRHGYRHHGGYHHYRAYPVYRWRTNFYGPNRNFYDHDRSYSYRFQKPWYPGDRLYHHGRPDHYRNQGGFYRQRPPYGRGRH